MTNLTNYGFDSDLQQIYDMIWNYSRDELHPLWQKMDEEDWFPEEQFRKLSEIGVLGITAPEEYGGAGLDEIAQVMAAEAMSYWNHTMCANYLAHDNLCVNNLLRNGSDDIKERFVTRLADGSAIGCLGITEPGAGSDALGSMKTTAMRDDDDYLINGRKMFITNGPCADIIMLYAKTNPKLGAHGISAFVLDADTPGFSVAQKLSKIGWKGSETGEFVFDNCRVPAANMVGEENQGVGIVMSGLNIERVVLAASTVGIAQRALDISVQYAKDREQFNRPIGSFQMVQSMLADMYTGVETMRSFVYQLSKEVSQMKKGEGGRGEIHKRTAAAVLHCGRTLMQILDMGVQIHGGMGFITESEINWLYRSGKIYEIGAGTNEVRKGIIAGELLK